MKISDLLPILKKPAAYTPGTAFMWTDPHISQQLLSIHLSQDTDLASRKSAAIETTLNFILEQKPNRPLHILDLGCGPGLYTEKLAAMGHRVTGMDISKVSIEHARESARRSHLDITYVNENYLEQDCGGDARYDLVMMIFTDFSVLAPHQRTELLGRVRRALKPQGKFVFDVLNTEWTPEDLGGKTWETSDGGFWRPGPYLCLSQTFEYDTDSSDMGLFLSQHLVADDKGEKIYRFYTQTFSDTALAGILCNAGFREVVCRKKILPDSDLYRSSQVTFCTAVK